MARHLIAAHRKVAVQVLKYFRRPDWAGTSCLGNCNMRPVAPGQWIDLQASSLEPLKHSDLTEVAYIQDGKTIIVAAPNPLRPHIVVPKTLSPGEVQLQVRTSRGGHASEWSKPETFRLTERPVPPTISALRLEKGNWAQLWPGPDRPKVFNATPGSVIVINGSFQVADTSQLTLTLTGPGGSIALTPYELNEKSSWFGDLCVKLPAALERGDWRMNVASLDDGTQAELPISIHIE